MCIVYESFSTKMNASLQGKLKHHLEPSHHNLVGQSHEYFNRKLKELKQQKRILLNMHQYQAMLC